MLITLVQVLQDPALSIFLMMALRLNVPPIIGPEADETEDKGNVVVVLIFSSRLLILELPPDPRNDILRFGGEASGNSKCDTQM